MRSSSLHGNCRCNVKSIRLRLGDLHADSVFSTGNGRPYFETTLGSSLRDEVHHDPEIHARSAASALTDKPEHAMLDLVLFARPGKKVTDADLQPRLVGKRHGLMVDEAWEVPSSTARYSSRRRSTPALPLTSFRAHPRRSPVAGRLGPTYQEKLLSHLNQK